MLKNPVLHICLVVLLVLSTLTGIFWDSIIDWLPVDQGGWDTLENGALCYLDEDGDPLTGWQELDSKIYYFDPESYAMQTGWLELENNRYYLGDDGARQAGWQTIGGQRYYLGENGVMHTGWLKQDSGMMYLNQQGNPHSGWLKLDDGTYYLDENGIMQTHWIKLDGSRYYLNEFGRLHSGWLEHGNQKYYLGPDGIPLTGWQTIENNVYYLGDNGIMHTGWLEQDGQEYYLKEDGTIARGKLVIDNKTCYFTSTGAQIVLINKWNPLPADYVPELREPIAGCQMDACCADALREMITDLENAVGRKSYLNGYRSYDYQKFIFRCAIDTVMRKGRSYQDAYLAVSTSTAPPGTSEHQYGVAVDIMNPNDTFYERGETAVIAWLKEHCWDYGFILRYPEGTSHITGIIYEPWHYRYVGVELAQELKGTGLCLEAYLDQLTNDGTTCGNPNA